MQPAALESRAPVADHSGPSRGASTGVAITVPAIDPKHARREAMHQLQRVGRAAAAFHAAHGMLPVGDSALSPETSCCSAADRRCSTDPARWSSSMWRLLDFAIDEPTMFQYRYQSDAWTFDVTAVGDLDCDGAPLIYRLHGRVAGSGEIQTTVIEPDPKSD